MFVALCDDDDYIIEDLKKLILEYGKANKIAITIDSYSDGYSLINSKRNYDFIVLDYMMDKLDGMQTARKLRKANCISTIVFLTSYPQFMAEAFEVNTFRFLTKPIDKNRLFKALDDYILIAKANYPITIIKDREIFKVESNEICYVEADGKYSNLHLKNDILHCSKTLAAVTKLLPQYCFVKTHRSYVVNLHCIESYTHNSIHMINNKTAYMSRSYYKPFQSSYMNFLDKYYVRL